MKPAPSTTTIEPKRRGRKPGPQGARLEPDKKGEVISMRVAGEERRAKLRRLGRDWLEGAIDRAKEPVDSTR